MTPLLWIALATAAPPPTILPTPAQAAEGWIALFDGESARNWEGVTVEGGKLVVPPGGTAECTTPLPPVDMLGKSAGGLQITTPADAGAFRVRLTNPATKPATLLSLWVRPTDAKPIFDGRSLAGWTPYAGDPKREKSQFTVTAAGELRLRGGPGDLQTVDKYDDFLLQLRCKTNGDHLNSGVFFRCIAGQYQQGYEVQINNRTTDGDPTKPTDFGTGAIYRRQPARQVVSRDREFFTLTLVARGPRFQTWVDGVPVLDWVDDRKPDDSPRKGLRLAPGHLSIQGHDPTTDIVFKDLRVAKLK